MTVKELGMPFYKTSYQHGNLFILFKVVFPDSLDKKFYDQIKKCLPSTDNSASTAKADQSCVMEEYHDDHKNSHQHPDDHDSNEEDDDGSHQG